MDQNQNQNSSGMMNGIPPVPHQEKKIGPIVGVLVIVLVLIIVALYFFSQKLNTTPVVQEAPVAQQTANQNANTANTASASASTDSETLNAELDAQLNNVDYSF